MITGDYNAVKAAKNKDFTDEDLKNMKLNYTEACHIVPFSFDYCQRWNASIIWDSIYRCFPSIRSRINFSAEKINDPCNIITMSLTLHTAFDRYQFTLNPAVSI